MKKQLFDQNERYTADASYNLIYNEVHIALTSILVKYVELGYSVREIENIMIKTVMDVAVEKRLDIMSNGRIS